jgi:hypothetical protein
VVRPLVVPTDVFFVRSHVGAPAIVRDARLRVEGLVKQPLDLTLGDLEALPRVSLTAVLPCSGNGRALHDPRVPGIQWIYSQARRPVLPPLDSRGEGARSPCHGDRARSGEKGIALSGRLCLDRAAEFAKVVRVGRARMPGNEDTTDPEVRDLLAYLRSLAGS